MSLSINVVPDLSEYSSASSGIGKKCSFDLTPENCPADTSNGRASHNNTCDVKDMNVELLSDEEPFEFTGTKEAVSQISIRPLNSYTRRFKVYYLNRLRDPNYKNKRFFKITWEEEEKQEETTDVKNYLIFTPKKIEASEISMTITEDRVIPCKSELYSKFVRLRKLTLIPPFTIFSEEAEEGNTGTEILKRRILTSESISDRPIAQIDEKILFYPQNLQLSQHDYGNNWSKLINYSFKQSDHTSVSVTDNNLPKGKDLIIVAGHQHSFRELFFPFQEISKDIFGTKEFRVGLRNGTCVMVGLFKDKPKGTLKDGEEYIRLVNGLETFYLDMRVVFTESYDPNRDKDKYIYLDYGDSLLYTKKKRKKKEGTTDTLEEKDCFRNGKNERNSLIEFLTAGIEYFERKSILLMRHGEAFHNLLDISSQLKKIESEPDSKLDKYDQDTLNMLEFTDYDIRNNLASFWKKDAKVKKWKKPNKILNSYLTPKGVYQARRIYYQYLKDTLPKFESVSYVCSSLDRTIETLINAVTGYDFNDVESTSSNPNITIGNQVTVTPGLTPNQKTPGLTPPEIQFTENPMSKILISNSTNQQSSQGIIDQTSITFPGKIKSIDSNEKTCTVTFGTQNLKSCFNVPFARIIREVSDTYIEIFKKKFDDIRSARGLIPDELKIVEPVKVEPVKVEPVKVEPVKVEPVEVEPVKVEPVKVEPVIEASLGGKRTTSKTLKKRPTRRHNRRKLVSTSKKFLQKKRTRVKNYPLRKLNAVSRKK